MSDATVSSPLPTGSAALPTSSGGAAPALTYTMGAQTDVGVRRSANEDAVTLPQIAGTDAAFIVADGMGGLAAGDIASGTAVRTVEASLSEQLAPDHMPAPVSPDLALLEALRRANDDVFRMTQAKRAQMVAEAGEAQTERQGGNSGAPSASNALMGTTCVAGIVKNNTLHLAHAGDSRAYLLRNGRLSRLTDDHSFVAERVKAGDMTEAEARISRFRNMITRAIGIDAAVQPDLSQTSLAPGDTVLACSDGLTTMLDDDEIADLLSAPQSVKLPPDRAATLLVDAANKKGGHDNVTVMILRVHGDGTASGTFAAPPTVAKTATRAGTANGATKSARSGSGSVLDVDGMGDKRRRKGPNFAVAALSTLGIATVLGGAILAAVPPFRTQFAAVLLGGRDEAATPGQKTPVKSAGPTVDYRKLTYGPAEDFGDYLARADILSYAPSKGLYFVAGNSGKIALLSRSGAALKSVGELPDMPPPPPNPVPPSRQFITSDAQGNVYVSYTGKRIVEKRGADGRLLATIRGFDRPEAIAVDENGNLYVIDYNQIKILRARLPDAPAPDASGSGDNKPAAIKPADGTKPARGNGATKPVSAAAPRPGA